MAWSEAALVATLLLKQPVWMWCSCAAGRGEGGRGVLLFSRPDAAGRGGEVAHATARLESRRAVRTRIGSLQLRGERAKACPGCWVCPDGCAQTAPGSEMCS